MKCYELNDLGELIPGFSITGSNDSPGVQLTLQRYIRLKGSPPKILFSAELHERLRAASDGGMFARPGRVYRCDLEKRADFWIVPETERTAQDALVLCNGLLPKSKKSPRAVWDAPLSITHLEVDATNQDQSWTGKASLVQLQPGASMAVFHAGPYRWSAPVSKRYYARADGILQKAV